MSDAALDALVDQVRAARADRSHLAITGGGSKAFYGEPVRGQAFDVTSLRGISSYEPTELVVTARCGTRLADLEATLAEKGQSLAFEPPHFGGAPVLLLVKTPLHPPEALTVANHVANCWLTAACGKSPRSAA